MHSVRPQATLTPTRTMTARHAATAMLQCRCTHRSGDRTHPTLSKSSAAHGLPCHQSRPLGRTRRGLTRGSRQPVAAAPSCAEEGCHTGPLQAAASEGTGVTGPAGPPLAPLRNAQPRRSLLRRAPDYRSAASTALASTCWPASFGCRSHGPRVLAPDGNNPLVHASPLVASLASLNASKLSATRRCS